MADHPIRLDETTRSAVASGRLVHLATINADGQSMTGKGKHPVRVKSVTVQGPSGPGSRGAGAAPCLPLRQCWGKSDLWNGN
jgi:hypothetical protein